MRDLRQLAPGPGKYVVNNGEAYVRDDADLSKYKMDGGKNGSFGWLPAHADKLMLMCAMCSEEMSPRQLPPSRWTLIVYSRSSTCRAWLPSLSLHASRCSTSSKPTAYAVDRCRDDFRALTRNILGRLDPPPRQQRVTEASTAKLG